MGRGQMHTELLQEAVTSENLLNEYKTIDKEKFLENSHILRDYLSHGSSKNMAQILCK